MNWFILIATVAAPIIAFVVSRVFERQAQLLTYYAHATVHKIEGVENSISYIRTHALVVRNTGRKAAMNVRVQHDQIPLSVTVSPMRDYAKQNLEGGGFEIVLATLVPKEEVRISYLYYPPLTWESINSRTKSNEGFAKGISIELREIRSAWLDFTIRSLVVLGMLSFGFLIIFQVLWPIYTNLTAE